MKKLLSLFFACLACVLFVGCGSGKCCSAIELMGAGDRIHDTYTFANSGVKIKDDGKNTYTIYGSVDKIYNDAVKKEFDIADDVTHVVALKLSAINSEVKKDEVEISTNGNRAYDAEHLNGSDYTFIIFEAVPNKTTTITVKWNKDAEELVYVIYFDSELTLK
jgi:hypothetical protein